MAKSTKDKKISSQKDESRKIVKAIIVTVVIFAVYMVALLNPLTGPYLQYPYYLAICGHKPVIASSFMGDKWYKTPDEKSYRVSSFDKFYCSTNQARAHGYSKY